MKKGFLASLVLFTLVDVANATPTNTDYSKIQINIDPHSQSDFTTDGVMSDKEKEIDQKEKIILDKIADKAEKGDPQSQVYIGLAYLNGKISGQPQYNIAMDWFNKAANQGDGDAMLQIGLMYMNASGRPQNTDEGMKWIVKGADHGSSIAKFTLATALRKQSHYYYVQSAEAGLLSGQIFSSLDFLAGNGVEQDFDQAYFWGKIAEHNGAIRLNENFVKQINKLGESFSSEKRIVLDNKIKDYISNVDSMSSTIKTPLPSN